MVLKRLFNNASREGNKKMRSTVFIFLMLILMHHQLRSMDAVSVDATRDLERALFAGSVDAVKELLDAELNSHSQILSTSLLHIAVIAGQENIVRELLESKFHLNINEQDMFGNTPLHSASKKGHVRIVEMLVAAGAQPDIRNRAAKIPLDYALKGRHLRIIEILLEKSGVSWGTILRELLPDLTLDNGLVLGRSLLHDAAAAGCIKLVTYLCDSGVEVTYQGQAGGIAEVTACHRAALGGHLDVAAFLIERGAFVNATATDGSRPLHWAARGGRREVVALLIDQGAELDAFTAEGKTPLHVASECGSAEVVSLLIEKKADANVLTHSGDTPLILAVRRMHIAAAEILISLLDPSEQKKILRYLGDLILEKGPFGKNLFAFSIYKW